MPLYDMRCPLCTTTWEVLARFNEEIRCPMCGCLANRLVSAPAFRDEISPYYDNGLGMKIESRDQRKRVLKAKGLEEVG